MKKLTNRRQMFFYACSAMGVNLLNIIVGSYLCSALLIGGFGEDAIKNQTFAGKDLVGCGCVDGVRTGGKDNRRRDRHTHGFAYR